MVANEPSNDADAIGLLVAYMIDQMTKKDEPLQIADFAAGSGNLLSTILLFLQSAGKTASATAAIDNDEVLVHLALQAFALEQLDVKTSYKMACKIYLWIRKTSW